MTNNRRLVALSAATLGVLVAACAEKTAAPELPGATRFSLLVSATTQRAAAPQRLTVIAAYLSNDLIPGLDSFRLLDTVSQPVTGGSQQFSLKVDISKCLSDPTRKGSRDACSLLIGAFLVPATFTDTS